MAKLFEGHPDWELRIILVAPTTEAKNPVRQSFSTIGEKLTEVETLVTKEHYDAAFLLGWAVLEAIARAAVQDAFDRPQTPGRVVETLAAKGVLTPKEADTLRLLIEKRNRLVHGELDVAVSSAEVEQFARLLNLFCGDQTLMSRSPGRVVPRQAMPSKTGRG